MTGGARREREWAGAAGDSHVTGQSAITSRMRILSVPLAVALLCSLAVAACKGGDPAEPATPAATGVASATQTIGDTVTPSGSPVADASPAATGTLVALAGATPAGKASPAASPAASGTAVAVAAATAAPANGEADALASKVQKAYESVKSLAAEFDQQTTLTNGSKGPKANGRVWIEKPGKMRWEFDAPEKKSFVSDGKTLWMYDAEENQVLVNEHMAETESLTALNFLEGFGDLKKEFNVAAAKAPESATVKEAAFLALTPKEDADVQVSKIVLALDRKSSLANEVFLVDGLGNETRLTFKNLKTNQAAPAKTFTFEIPKGAEVIKPQLLQR